MAAPVQYNDMANFSFGVRSFGTPLLGETTGRIFFVDSTNTANKGDDILHGNTPQAPFATIDFAIGQCEANRGDIIKVLPGHAETITAAGAINLDVAGVTIEGLGTGRARPIITFASSVAASINFNAANCKLLNVVLDMTGIDSLGQGGGTNGGIRLLAADSVVADCEIIIATTGNQVKNAIGLSTAASRARILNNLIAGTTADGPLSAIQLYGNGAITVEGVEIGWNRIVGNFDTSAINISLNAGTDALLNVFIHDNVVTNADTVSACLAFTAATDCSGVVLNNNFIAPTAASTYSSTIAGISNINNTGYDLDDDGVYPITVPVVGTLSPSDASIVDQILGQEFSAKQANYLEVEADMSSATWNTVATHEVLTVTGAARIILIPVCTVDLTDGGGGAIQAGDEAATNGLIASTTANTIDADEFWLTTTPAKRYAKSSVLDFIVNGLDIGYEITGAALTGGTLKFKAWWIPLDAAATVVAGTGAAL